jgi:hypothetical protein
MGRSITVMKKMYIFADRVQDGEYYGSELDSSLDTVLDGLEYGDVATKQFQVWEYPSGKIYDIVPDRYALSEDNYSVSDPDVWLPKLEYRRTDEELIFREYKRLT